MKKLFVLLLVLTAVACAVKIDPVKVDGEIRHVVEIDPTKLHDFTTGYCDDKYTDPSDRDACTSSMLDYFWKALASSSASSPNPSHSP